MCKGVRLQGLLSPNLHPSLFVPESLALHARYRALGAILQWSLLYRRYDRASVASYSVVFYIVASTAQGCKRLFGTYGYIQQLISDLPAVVCCR